MNAREGGATEVDPKRLRPEPKRLFDSDRRDSSLNDLVRNVGTESGRLPNVSTGSSDRERNDLLRFGSIRFDTKNKRLCQAYSKYL